MKKTLLTLTLLLASASAVAFDCLPKQLNASFSGTSYQVSAVPGIGEVHSWDCPPELPVPRQRFIRLINYQLNASCSSISITTFRNAEGSALTTVKNAIKKCGGIPPVGTEEYANWNKLAWIGLARPEVQIERMKEFFPIQMSTLIR